MNALYIFQNPLMDGDLVNPKTGKVEVYKDIYVIATSEEDARTKAARAKLDKDGRLSRDYVLMRVDDLGKDWN